MRFGQITKTQSQDSALNKFSSDGHPDGEKQDEVRLKECDGRMIEQCALKSQSEEGDEKHSGEIAELE